MLETSNIEIVFSLAIIIIIAWLIIKKITSTKTDDQQPQATGEPKPQDIPIKECSAYKLKRNFLTQSEQEFYKLLTTYLPHDSLKIFSQVLYTALIKEKQQIDSKYRNKYNSYYLDFVICNEKFQPVCVIELDDFRHRTYQKNN